MNAMGWVTLACPCGDPRHYRIAPSTLDVCRRTDTALFTPDHPDGLDLKSVDPNSRDGAET